MLPIQSDQNDNAAADVGLRHGAKDRRGDFDETCAIPEMTADRLHVSVQLARERELVG